jgi:DNA polymerase I-like protein with 3'-5' exonuclease and polymerase domains
MQGTAADLIKLAMVAVQDVAKFDVPSIVDVGVGANWDQAH